MIVLGADVGKSTGLVVLDCSGARPQYIARACGRESLVEVTRAIFQAHDIRLVGIETPSQVFEHGRAQESEGARRSIERALLVARDAAGQVRAVAGMSGAEVHDGQAHHVRRAVLGKLPKTGVDRFIATRLPLLVDGWPARSNDHERDAAIVALWAWQRAKVGLKPGESALRSKVKRSRPTVGDLRDAAERVLSKTRKPHPDECDCDGVLHFKGGQGCKHQRPMADPGEERAACMLVPCPGCFAAAGKPCTGLGAGGIVYGVHPPRAVAAGITGVQVPRAEPRAPTGPRKLATVRLVECWARLPWSKPCGACKGRPDADVEIEGQALPGLCGDCDGLGLRVVRWKAAEEKGALAEVVMEIAPDHKAAWMTMCKACVGQGCSACGRVGRTHKFRMIRRPWRRAGVECWLYEPAT